MMDLLHLDKWDKRFLSLAQHVGGWSRDPSTQVGAVVSSPDNRVMGLGYNGFARGIADTDERLQNREEKYKLVLHAEENAMAFASKTAGCTLYTWPLPLCPHCMSLASQHGIIRTVSPKDDGDGRWPFALSLEIAQEAGIEMVLVDL